MTQVLFQTHKSYFSEFEECNFKNILVHIFVVQNRSMRRLKSFFRDNKFVTTSRSLRIHKIPRLFVNGLSWVSLVDHGILYADKT